MADGYAAVTGRPALAVLITGPGVTNAATGVAQAHHDSRPQLVLSSAVASEELDRPRGSLHDLPGQERLLSDLCAINETVRDPERLPEILADAFALFHAGRPRPVHISIPIDLLAAPAPRLEPLWRPLPRPQPDPEAVAGAAALLAAAAEPVILAGGGALAAGEQLAALAERLGAPVLLSGNAKGILPGEGGVGVEGALATAPALAALAAADVVLAVGTEISSVEQAATGAQLRLPGRLVRVDIDPAQLHNRFTAEVGIAADAATALAALADRLGPDPGADPARASRRAAALREAVASLGRAGELGPWVDAVAASLPTEAVVAVDSAQLAYAMHDEMKWSSTRSWLAPYGFGTLGPALPMAIGAKSALAGRPVVAVAGDGGALFTIAELATAVQERLPLTFVVWNSSSYEEIREAMDARDYTPLGTTLGRVRFADLARAFGCDGLEVETPDQLAAALAERIGAERPTVIDVVAG